MKKLLLFTPLIVLFACAPKPVVIKEPAVIEAPPVRVTPLTGEWREMKNQGLPVRAGKRWVFSDDKITIDDGQTVYTGTFGLNESASPKEMDFQFEGFPVNEGIYRIEGDTLTVKVLETALERAKDFSKEEGYTLVECAREKTK